MRSASAIVITCIVSTQFIDVEIANIADFSVTVPKLGALAALGTALFSGVFKMHRGVVATGTLLVLSLTVAHIADTPPVGLELSTVLTAALSVLAGLALFGALSQDPVRGAKLFNQVLISSSAITAVLIVLQSLELIPLVTVPVEDLERRIVDTGAVRATGLKYDPNFAALLLCMGLGASRARHSNPLISALILAGIVLTYSRMGIILALIVMAAAYWLANRSRSAADGLVRFAGLALAFIALVTVTAALLGTDTRALYGDRFRDLNSAYGVLGSGNASLSSLTSGEERALLNRAGIDLFLSNPLTGVGAGNVEPAMTAYGLRPKAVHNTYIELAATGGLFGLALIGCLLFFTINAARAAPSLNNEQWGLILGGLTILVASLVVTLLYSFMLIMAIVLLASATSAWKDTTLQWTKQMTLRRT